MLVLTRKSEQKIIIGKNIVITILKVQGDQVSVGIQAPKELPIYREELLDEIRNENVAAIDKASVDVGAVTKSLPKNLQKPQSRARNVSKIGKTPAE